MTKPKTINVDDLIGPIKHSTFFTYWDKALGLLGKIEEQHPMHLKEKIGATVVIQCYEFQESHVFYWEQSIFGPKHPWIKELIDDKIIYCPECETHHFTHPDASPHSDELPIFYHLSPQMYELKKRMDPDGDTAKIFETWPRYTRYTLKITKRAEKNIDRILNTESIIKELKSTSSELSDAVSIEIPIVIGKIDVLKLWKWLKK